MEIVNKGIERNIDAQKQEFEQKREGIQLKNNAYAMLRQKGLDDAQARLAIKQHLLEQFMAKTDEISARYSAPLIRNNAQQAIDKAQQELLNTKIQQYLISRPKTQETFVNQEVTKAGAGAKQLPAEQANSLGAAAGSIKDVDDLMGQWVQKASKFGSGITQWIPQTDADKYNDARHTAVAHIGRALGEKGVFTEKDFERYYDALPAPSDTFATAQNKIAAVKQMITNDIKSRVDALGGAGFAVEGVRQQVESPEDAAARVGAKKIK